MLSPLIENKKYIQDNFTLSKKSKPSTGNDEYNGLLLLANYGSKIYIFDTTYNKKDTSMEDVLKYNLDTHKKEILPNTGMPFARYGPIKFTRIGHYLWVGYNRKQPK